MDELAEAPARGAHRVELLGPKQRKPDCLRRSTTAVRLREHQPARRDRTPEGDRRQPPRATSRRGAATAAVLPPSAIGSGSALIRAAAKPSTRASAASTAPEDALEASRRRENGHARVRSTPVLRFRNSASVISGIRRSIANESPSRPRKKRPTPTSTEASISCSPMPNANPFAYGTPCRTSARDRRRSEPHVARPEREDRRQVHQHEDEARCRQWNVDVESEHRRVHREELAQPAEALEQTALIAGSGSCITPRPYCAIVTIRRAFPASSRTDRWWRRALTNASRNRIEPTEMTAIRLVSAQPGAPAVART